VDLIVCRYNTMIGRISLAALLSTGIPVMQAVAQASGSTNGSVSDSAQPSTSQTAAQPDSNGSKANQPLVQSNEGFWGHMNPFARKKWVNRQLNPVKDRLNELDELSASNAREIKDVDARAQAGIQHAQSTADAASQQAAAANGLATQAQTTSQQSVSRTQQLGTTVANLDQYQTVSETEIRFRPGQTALNAKAKDALDGIASDLQSQKGYLIEVKGFASGKGQAGIQTSQHLADSVVRYLVEQHDVPVYRIHLAALGNASNSSATGAANSGNTVYVTLTHNSLAALNSPGNSGGSPIGATQQQPSPQGAPSQPSVQQQQ
jgi:outer membrane protein OmpA-like peptidoglycan-associated protein